MHTRSSRLRLRVSTLAARALLGALLALSLAATGAGAAGPPYPNPTADTFVYDPDGMLEPATVRIAESASDTLNSIGLQLYLFAERSPATVSPAQAGRNSDQLVQQWKVSRGFVVLATVGEGGCGGSITIRRGTGIDASTVTDDAIATVTRNAQQFLAACDPDTAVLVGLSNLTASAVSAPGVTTGGPVATVPPGPAGSPGLPVIGSQQPVGGPPAAGTAPAGPPYPEPVDGRYVYDQAGVFQPATIAKVQAQIQAIRDRTGSQIVVYTQVVGLVVTESQAEADAQALMDQWGVGRRGFDDGLVILFDLDTSKVHGQVQLYAGPGYRATFLSNSDRQSIFDNDMLPRLKAGDLDGALIIAMDRVDANATADHAATLSRARVVNSVIGLVGAPIALLLLIAWPVLHWLRYGRDPDFIDDPSILMPAPPADLTAAAGALVFDGRSTRHTLTTAMLDLASRDEIAFRPEVHRLARDAMGIEIRTPDTSDAQIGLNRRKPISPAEVYAQTTLAGLSVPDENGVPMVDSKKLLEFGPKVSTFDSKLETYVTRKGWFRQTPQSATNRWYGQGTVEIVLGIIAAVAGASLPSDGLVLVGIAVVVAGVVTLILARTMPARTLAGATIRAMLAAYRRTLAKTFAMSRSMDQVVASRALPWLETPDQALVWGVALGLRSDVEDVLQRTAADLNSGRADTTYHYLPTWYGASGWQNSGTGAGGIAPGLFSGSAVPNFDSMMGAISTIGNSPSSSGGGYGGGGSGGGGGGSGGGF